MSSEGFFCSSSRERNTRQGEIISSQVRVIGYLPRLTVIYIQVFVIFIFIRVGDTNDGVFVVKVDNDTKLYIMILSTLNRLNPLTKK